jgi:hypothetical protein
MVAAKNSAIHSLCECNEWRKFTAKKRVVTPGQNEKYYLAGVWHRKSQLCWW